MFGGLCFILSHLKCLREKYASEMDFTGKAMRGMICVAPEGFETDPDLATWFELATRFVDSLPPNIDESLDMKTLTRIFSIAIIAMFMPCSYAEQTGKDATKTTTANDLRQLVTMPAQAQELMRKDMLDHLAVMNELMGLLAENKWTEAGTLIETRMGKSTMGKHRATGMGPGRFMPVEMHSIGIGMHEAASEFAELAKKGDTKNAYLALQKVNGACVACHYTYRTR